MLKALRSLKVQSADVTLIAILIIAALSQNYPRQSTVLTLLACALAGAFAISAYVPRKESEPAKSGPETRPASGLADVDLSNIYSICRAKHWYSKSFALPSFEKKFIATFHASHGWAGKHASPRRSDLFDLTDALPDRCTVRIGMLEIRLEDGETSVKMKSDIDRDPPRPKRETVFLGMPTEADMASDTWKVN